MDASSTLAETGNIIMGMGAETGASRKTGSVIGYATTLVGAVLFVASCFMPFYGFPNQGSVTRYDQLTVGQDVDVGAILILFGGVTVVFVVAIVGLARSRRDAGPVQFLAGAVAAWSLTWIGALLQTASLREGRIMPVGLTLEIGFWLQAVSIGLAVIGTILVAIRRVGAHERHAAGFSSRG
ncbi:MAG TPA: hypothetical protein VFT27_10845 [Actinomycetota bacterium]|nr:hypothetical protein [Actinomycetota bacterium]